MNKARGPIYLDLLTNLVDDSLESFLPLALIIRSVISTNFDVTTPVMLCPNDWPFLTSRKAVLVRHNALCNKEQVKAKMPRHYYCLLSSVSVRVSVLPGSYDPFLSLFRAFMSAEKSRHSASTRPTNVVHFVLCARLLPQAHRP